QTSAAGARQVRKPANRSESTFDLRIRRKQIPAAAFVNRLLDRLNLSFRKRLQLRKTFERQKHIHHCRIELDSRAIDQYASCRFFCHRGAEWSCISERGVRISQSQDPRCERYLFTSQRVRIAGAVPPFMMPADEQLRRAIRSDSRRLAFAKHRVPRKIESLFRGHWSGSLDVIA